jgi:hypothetical protein
MTPTRWLIVAFWVFVLLMGAKSFYDYNSHLDHEEAAQSEKHYFPPSLMPGAPAAPSTDADVRQIRYTPKENDMTSQFTAEVVIKNFGQKKATNIQVRIQPYIGTVDNSGQPGPDEILGPNSVDPTANVFRWVEFPDLGPGETASQTLTFPMRSDAAPRGHFDPKITFQTAPDKP